MLINKKKGDYMLKKRKLKASVKYFLYAIVLGVVANVILNVNLVDFVLRPINDVFKNPFLFLVSLAVIIPLILILLVLTNNVVLTSLITLFTSIIFSIVNILKLELRNEPLYPEDFGFIHSLRELLDMIQPDQRTLIFFFTSMFIVLVMASIILTKKKKLKIFNHSKEMWIKRFALASILIVMIMYSSNFNRSENLVRKVASAGGFYDAKWDQKLLYEKNGFVLGFSNNLPGKIMNDPKDYSKTKVASVIEKYSVKADLINEERKYDSFEDVSLVYILSESFSDPENINGITMSESPVDFVGDGKKQYNGNVVVPSYGGGTTNSEFEVLTGFSIQNLLPNMSLPFQDFLGSYTSLPSIVSDFNKNPINKAISLHAFTDAMYKRPTVYKALGFNESYYRDNLYIQEGVESSVYVSDESIYADVINRLKVDEQNAFYHVVTMQNHAPYTNPIENNQFVLNEAVETTYRNEIEVFSKGVSISDSATKQFIQEIEKMDRKVIVVFYGDHLPGLYSDFLKDNNAIVLASTPYFVYSNFSKERMDIGETQSLTLMNNLVKDLADVKMSPYDALILELRTEIPAGRFEYYVNQNNDINIKEDLSEYQKELLKDYYLIQYDLLQGKSYTNMLIK